LLTLRSLNRATSAPACSGRPKWWVRGGSFRYVGFVGFMSGFLEVEPRRNPKNSEATGLPFTIKRFTSPIR
jgi:hypothetical protein